MSEIDHKEISRYAEDCKTHGGPVGIFARAYLDSQRQLAAELELRPNGPQWTCIECGESNPEWFTSETAFGTEHDGCCADCGGALAESPKEALHSVILAFDTKRAELETQLANERARVQALCDVIHDANGIAYPFKEMQDKMTAILNAQEPTDA